MWDRSAPVPAPVPATTQGSGCPHGLLAGPRGGADAMDPLAHPRSHVANHSRPTGDEATDASPSLPGGTAELPAGGVTYAERFQMDGQGDCVY